MGTVIRTTCSTLSAKTASHRWQHNSDVCLPVVLHRHELPRITAAFCRFHAHGELINHIHFINFVNIARDNPHCTFALWTKRKDFVWQVLDDDHHSKPPNLILVWSNPQVDKVVQSVPRHCSTRCLTMLSMTQRHKTARVKSALSACVATSMTQTLTSLLRSVKEGTGRVPKSLQSNGSGVTINV